MFSLLRRIGTRRVLVAILVLVAVYLIVLLIFLLRRKKSATSSSVETDNGYYQGSYPLQYGSNTGTGASSPVFLLQQHIARLGIADPSTPDGIWGQRTENAVAILQSYTLYGNEQQITPFAPYIHPVVSPTSALSHWQITTPADCAAILNIKL